MREEFLTEPGPPKHIKPWKHLKGQTPNWDQGEYMFDGYIDCTTSLFGTAVRHQRYGPDTLEFPVDVRKYLKKLARIKGGLNSVQLFELWDRRKFFCICNATRAEVEKIMTPTLERFLKSRDKRYEGGFFIREDPNQIYCFPAFFSTQFKSGTTFVDDYRQRLVYPGSGIPTNKRLFDIIDPLFNT